MSDQKFAEPVALSSTQPADRPLPRRALRRSLDLIALRARRRKDPKRSRGRRQTACAGSGPKHRHRPLDAAGGLEEAGGLRRTSRWSTSSASSAVGGSRRASPAVCSAPVSRLLVLGDLHCDRRHLRGLVERAVEERCDALVSLGDLFYLPRDPEGRRFLRSAGALLRQVSLELLLVDGNHDDAEALARARTRSPAPGPVPLGFHMHHLPAGTRFQLGRLRCLACGGAFSAWSPRAGRDWHRTAARERAALNHLAGGGEIDLLFCHDPRTLEQGAQAHGSFAALAAKLRPALVIYAHQHRPHVSAAEQPALVGLGSFKDGHFSAVVLDSAETGRLVRALRRAQAGAQPEAHR
jgi:predicted phosphodiesterase